MREVQALVPEIDFSRYLKGLAPSGYPITDNTTVLVTHLDWYRNVSKVIQSTSWLTLQDYFRWRIIATWSSSVHGNYSAPLDRFNNMLAGKNSTPDRWRTCLTGVDSTAGHILGSFFIRRAFSTNDKVLGERILENIKTVFAENLGTISWMSNATKELAAQKGV